MSRAREDRRKNSRLTFTLTRNPAYVGFCPQAVEHHLMILCGSCAYGHSPRTFTSTAATLHGSVLPLVAATNDAVTAAASSSGRIQDAAANPRLGLREGATP